MIDSVVVDTNVLIAAMMSAAGGSREVLRLCLERRCQPLVGQKLFAEYEDVLGRTGMLDRSPLSPKERDELLDAFLSVCDWTAVFFLWRPNVPDEGDNHLIELAVAGGATSLITHNVKHLRGRELRFPPLRIESPREFLKRWRTGHGDYDD